MEALAAEPNGFASAGSLTLFTHAMVKLAYSSKKVGKAECKKMFSQDIKGDVVTAGALQPTRSIVYFTRLTCAYISSHVHDMRG